MEIASCGAPDINTYAERFVGSIRREDLNWFVIFTESQLQRIVQQYIFYYNNNYYRMHQGIQGIPSGYQPQEEGKIISMPVVSGLHHHYYRKAS
ncbi:MAG: transposase [Spirochaetales bacterium]|nr:transposase [Spirochaetales bacterium]